MRLAKLTGLERDALIAEIKEVGALIARLEEILESEQILMAVVISELRGDQEASTATSAAPSCMDVDIGDIDVEDMIAPEEMVVTVTHGGYVKRSPKTLYRAQRRGGRGITGAATHEEDFVAAAVRRVDARHAADAHQQGARLLQEGVGGAAGGPHRQGQGVRQPDPAAGGRAGRRAAARARVLRGGVRRHGDAPRPDQEDVAGRVRQHPRLRHHRADASPTTTIWSACASPRGRPTCCSGTRNGWAIRFREENVRPMGRSARGVRGIRLRKGSGGRRRGRRHGGHPARGAGDAADRVREGLRQAHADVRLPDQEPRRQGRHHHQDHRTQRQGGRPAPGHRRRRPDADHRRRQADPHAGRAASRPSAATRRACA